MLRNTIFQMTHYVFYSALTGELLYAFPKETCYKEILNQIFDLE